MRKSRPDLPIVTPFEMRLDAAVLPRRCSSGTDIGRKRKSNEDACFVDNALGLYVVADGMGGHAAGEVASQEAVDVVYGMVKRGISGVPLLREPVSEAAATAGRRLLESAIQAATYMVHSMAQLDVEKKGMGTTLSAMLAHGDYAILGQVGDSRIYRVRGDVVEQITEDHTLIAWQLKNGLISTEDAKRSPLRNVITRAVGNHDYVQVDTALVPLAAGDKFLLCSDGLHGYLKEGEVAGIVALGGDAAIKGFVDLANSRGGKDNITAVLAEFG